MSRRAFQQQFNVAKYALFQEMYWDNDLEARPEDRVATEPPKEHPLPLIPEELPVDDEDSITHPISVTEDTDKTTEQSDAKTFVDAYSDLTEFEENSPDPYAILRDHPFALVPPETANAGTRRGYPNHHTHSHLNHRAPRKAKGSQTPNRGPRNLHHLPHLTSTWKIPRT